MGGAGQQSMMMGPNGLLGPNGLMPGENQSMMANAAPLPAEQHSLLGPRYTPSNFGG